MTSQSEWKIGKPPIDPDATDRLFFTEHEWETVDALSARIIPTDHDPGAREARVVLFIDRYLSGTDYVFAAADGSGFLEIEGKPAATWKQRIEAMQTTYREGIAELDAICEKEFGAAFIGLGEDQQDEALVKLSGEPKPEPVKLGTRNPSGTFLQGVSDAGMGFWDAILLHTRQGFYGDPAYGGNKDQVSWKMIGFPGPESLAATNDCSYSVRDHFVHDVAWQDLIPFMREKS